MSCSLRSGSDCVVFKRALKARVNTEDTPSVCVCVFCVIVVSQRLRHGKANESMKLWVCLESAGSER